MIQPDTLASLRQGDLPKRFDVRSVTGARYTLIEDTIDDGGIERRVYCTAYARLPVIANGDGTFTIVDTRTRLVRVDPP